MASFKPVEVARVIKRGVEDKTSAKRLREIMKILRQNGIPHSVTPKKLRDTFEQLGPTFVKLGQIMSSRSDFLPEEYCQELASLRSDATPLTFEEIEEHLNRSFDGDYHTVFSSVDTVPLGSASVAQVHKAILKESNRSVAVKIQRQGIKEKMTQDLELLRRANDLLEVSDIDFGNENIDMGDLIDELQKSIAEEIDFRVEAKTLKEFRKKRDEDYLVTSPRVYDEYSSEGLLVMEFIAGYEISDVAEIKRNGLDPTEIGNRIANNYVKQILVDGLFHADPHQANILIRKEEVVWIDMGIVGRLSDPEKALMSKLFKAIATKDAAALKEVLLTWGKPMGKINHARMMASLNAMLTRYGSNGIADLNLSQGLMDLLELLREQHLKMPADFMTLARGLMTLEGTLEALSPEISITSVLSSFLQRQLIEDFDPVAEAERIALLTRKNIKKSAAIPSQLGDLLSILSSGEAQVNIDLDGVEQPVRKLGRSVEIMALGIITAGLFIGSSTLCTTNMHPQIWGIPLIGFTGYLGALILSVYIVYQVHKSRRKLK